MRHRVHNVHPVSSTTEAQVFSFLLFNFKSFWTINCVLEKHSPPQEDAPSDKFLFCEGQGFKSKFDPYAGDNLNLLQELNDLHGAAFLRTSQIFCIKVEE